MGVWFERYGSIEVEKAKSVEQTSSEGLPPIDEAMIRYPKGRKGRWVKAEGKVVGFDVDKFQSCKALDAKDSGSKAQIDQMQFWQWEGLDPDVMDLKQNEVYDAAKRCLSGKKIVFIGDSLQRQMHHAGVCMLHAAGHDAFEDLNDRIVQTFPTDTGTFPLQECWHFPSLEHARMCYVLNYWTMADLRSPLKYRDHKIDLQREIDWARLGGLTEHWARQNPGPNVFVWSTGTWSLGGTENDWKPLITKTYRAMLDRMEELFQMNLLNVNQTYVVYRTLSQNHYEGESWVKNDGCKHDMPLQYSSSNDLYATEFTGRFVEGGMTDRANRVLYEELARKPPSYRYWVLDGQAVAKERCDAHPGGGDCLHFVLPSVPVVWNRILIKHLCEAYGQ